MDSPQSPHHDDGGRSHTTLLLWWLVPVGLVVAMLAVGLIAVTSLSATGDRSDSSQTPVVEAATRKLKPYWTVKSGDTYSHISEKTGLTIADLQTFNPRVDPATIKPGQRIKLRMSVPKPRKRPGPRYWTVRPGQSYGSIAAATKTPIDTLMRLNAKLKPAALKVGDRVRLRR